MWKVQISNWLEGYILVKVQLDFNFTQFPSTPKSTQIEHSRTHQDVKFSQARSCFHDACKSPPHSPSYPDFTK